MSIWHLFDILLYGFIIAIFIVMIWLYYAYTYRTSIERLSKLAAQKYMMIATPNQRDQYVIQCDRINSYYNDDTKIFTAVITFTPDLQHPSAPKLPNKTMLYKVTDKINECDPNDLKQYIYCINIDE